MKTSYVIGLCVVCLLFFNTSAEAADKCYIHDTGNECWGPDPLPDPRQCSGTCEDDGEGVAVCSPASTKVWSAANKEKTWTDTIEDDTFVSINPDSEEKIVCWTGKECLCEYLMEGDECVKGQLDYGNNDWERILTDDWCHEQE